jgi:putative oxidoreductase
MVRRQLFIELIASLLILLFLYASVSKFLAFDRHIHDMYNQPLPRFMRPFLVWGVPFLEVAISIALIFETSRTIGLYASLILMVLFTVYTGFVLFHFFRYVPCSCGGVIRKLTWGQHMMLNLFFVGLALTGIILQRKRSKSHLYSSLKTFSYEKS